MRIEKSTTMVIMQTFRIFNCSIALEYNESFSFSYSRETSIWDVLYVIVSIIFCGKHLIRSKCIDALAVSMNRHNIKHILMLGGKGLI